MIFRLKNIARKKHPPLTLSVGSAATHKKQLPSVKLEHSKRLVPRYLQLYLCSSLSLFPISLSLSVPGNPCVWADVQSHHEHCGDPSPLSSSAPYCPRFPFVLLISFFFFFTLRYHKMDGRTERLHRFFAKKDLNLATTSNAIVIIWLIYFALRQFRLIGRFNSS